MGIAASKRTALSEARCRLRSENRASESIRSDSTSERTIARDIRSEVVALKRDSRRKRRDFSRKREKHFANMRAEALVARVWEGILAPP